MTRCNTWAERGVQSPARVIAPEPGGEGGALRIRVGTATARGIKAARDEGPDV